jgi:hypothetical protein
VIYLYLMLCLAFYASYKAARKEGPAKARKVLNLGLSFALVFTIVGGGYALGRDLGRSDNAAHDLCRR